MRLFLDANDRLYLIFVGVNRKTLWVPLSYSDPRRHTTQERAMPTVRREVALSTLNTASIGSTFQQEQTNLEISDTATAGVQHVTRGIS